MRLRSQRRAAMASAIASPAAAQVTADNTLDRIRANKVLRIAVLQGELPYFNKDLASGTWSGFSIEMANDIAKLLIVQLEFTRVDLWQLDPRPAIQQDRFGLRAQPDPQRALVVDFCATVFPHPFGAMLKKGLEAKSWADINKPEVRNRGRRRLRQRGGGAPLRVERDHQVAEVARRGHAGDVVGPGRLRRQRAGAWPDRDRQEPESRQLQDPAVTVGRYSLQHGGAPRAR